MDPVSTDLTVEEVAKRIGCSERNVYRMIKGGKLEAIQKELGDTEDERFTALKERAAKKNWPEHAKTAFEGTMKKVERESHHSPDYQMDVT